MTDRRDAMGRMRQELHGMNPISLVRTTASGLSEARAPSSEAAGEAGPLQRTLGPELRRNLFILSAISLLATLGHSWILGLLSGYSQGWQTLAASFLSLPFPWAQPIVAAIGGIGLLVVAIVSRGFTSMTVNQARSATILAWTAAIGSGALVIFGIIYLIGLLLIAALGIAIVALVIYIVIGVASA